MRRAAGFWSMTRSSLSAGAVLALGSVVLAQDVQTRSPEEMHRLHQDRKAYIAFLDDPARDAYQKPHEVIRALDLKPGEVVADIGSGSGYFTLRVAAHVGETGRVYGVDVDPEMVQHLNRRVRDAGVRNVQVILADPDDPLLPEPVDRFLIVDTWHHIGDQARYLVLMRKLLKPGGQVVMIDFQKKELPLGPPLAMKIAREDLIRQMESSGFQLAQEHTFLPYQYFLVFEAKPLAGSAASEPAQEARFERVPPPAVELAKGLDALRFLIGEWQAEGGGTPGAAGGGFAFASALQGRSVLRTSFASYPATAAKAASRHDDIMVFYATDAGDLRADYYDSEGHVIRYSGSAPAAGELTLVSEAAPGLPRFRLSYRLGASGVLEGRFEIAPPGKPDAFGPYLAWTARRSGRGSRRATEAG
jgi:ubiquinone/menaquinone biosynthesis C-methylase UbiE